MKIYRSKYGLLFGTSYDESIRAARRQHQKIQQLTKRQPYVRSQYFAKDKVFLTIFWTHLMQKRRGERVRRAKLYLCAVDLLRNTSHDPDTVVSKIHPNELLYRFAGQTKEGAFFIVQIKHNKKTGRKDFISVFPKNKF